MHFLDTTLFFVSLGLLLTNRALCSSDRERDFVFHHFSSKKLSNPSGDLGARDQSKQVKKKMDCIWVCTDQYWCRSVNVKKTPLSNGLLECKLLSSYRLTSGAVLTDDPSYDHYSIESPCERNPCGIGATCSSLYNRRDYQCNCTNPGVALGMQSKAIPDSKITASSIFSSLYPPHHGRLMLALRGWAPSTNQVGQWIQVDLSSVTTVTAVATQGRSDAGEWVKSYSLQYSMDGVSFKDYEQGKVFTGNTDQQTVVRNDLDVFIKARFIRLLPRTGNGDFVVRMELYGCR